MADPQRHVYRRHALELGGRFAGKVATLLAGRSLRALVSYPKSDRGSVFVCHLAWPIKSPAEAVAAVSALMRKPAVADAHHAMSAWRDSATRRVPAPPKPATPGKRKPSKTAPIKTENAFDDDGEARGGASIRAELNARKAVGYAVVVTRFYGAGLYKLNGFYPELCKRLNIGKARFDHIRERTAAMLAAAGCLEGVMAESDAWRGAGRVLGAAEGMDALAAALGGVPMQPPPQPQPPSTTTQPPTQPLPTQPPKGKEKGQNSPLPATGKIKAASSKGGKVFAAAAATATTATRDIRQCMAEAAERRAQAAVAGSGSGSGSGGLAAGAGVVKAESKVMKAPSPLRRSAEHNEDRREEAIIDLCDDDEENEEDGGDAAPASKRSKLE